MIAQDIHEIAKMAMVAIITKLPVVANEPQKTAKRNPNNTFRQVARGAYAYALAMEEEASRLESP